MSKDDAQLRELLRVVAATAPEEIDCDEFLARVGAYLEAAPRCATLPPAFNTVSQHLEICPECHEEFEALLRVYGYGADGAQGRR